MTISEQAFFTSDTAAAPLPEAAQQGKPAPAAPVDRKTLAERLLAAWMAPWKTGFTPVW